MMIPSAPPFLLLLLVFAPLPLISCSSSCSGCDVALASYYLSQSEGNNSVGLNLTYIASLFGQSSYTADLDYNNLTSPNFILSGTRVNIAFRCDCLAGGRSLGHTFSYRARSNDTYNSIASSVYSNLTTAAALAAGNSYPAYNIPIGATLNVTIGCYCGDADVSRDYGLFVTYPLRQGETLASVGAEFGFSTPANQSLLQRYNSGANFSAGEGIVFVPTKDKNGSYHPLPSSSSGLSAGIIAGISVAAIVVLLVIVISLYFGVFRRYTAKKPSPLLSTSEEKSILHGHASSDQNPELNQAGSASQLTAFTVNKSVEFSYEELATATNDFSMANKIGEGGFGAVYYAELRGEKAAIKKMDMQASREFLAELKVLTHVHHFNLVRLIGYCIEGSLFVVYEFVENGNLSQHLRGSARDPLKWSTRVQIALDSARGLEYIHEHTVPVYIHRDIKSANILIDNNFRGKVADFGLTKLTQVGGMSLPTRLVGTFGYMPPEYAQLGDVSPKVDVYAFGVVLYELISAKEAIVKSESESRGLVALFEDALSQADPEETLKKLVDPRLGDNYPVDSVHKMALLAKACTQENPQLRPSMRSVVVALMTLSSSTEEWDDAPLYENQALVNLMSGR